LELENVTKRYGRRVALDSISLSVGRGITGLLGPNGSGKSTLIKSLLGLLKLQHGRATVLGYQLPSQIREIRDRVGYLPEDDCFLAGLTGIESVTFMARLAGLPPVEGLRRAHEVLDYSDIGQERYRNVETYSTGMRQKLKFAQAVVHDPELLILDEPTTGLDPQQRVALLQKIRTLATDHQKSIVISTHILHDVSTVCEHVVIMVGGRIKLVDSVENLSRPVRGGVQVRVEPAGATQTGSTQTGSQTAVEHFANFLSASGWEVEMQEDGSLWVHSLESADSQRLWQAARECGVRIHHLAAARNSLEEVFMDTVREASHAAP
jgi:ABC-2 type transport system ATP-binding protein